MLEKERLFRQENRASGEEADLHAKQLAARAVIKNLNPRKISAAMAEVRKETESNQRKLDLKNAERVSIEEIAENTLISAGALASEKGFWIMLNRARAIARVQVATQLVDREEYKEAAENRRSRRSHEFSDKLKLSEVRAQVEVEYSQQIIQESDTERKLAAMVKIDEMALKALKEERGGETFGMQLS